MIDRISEHASARPKIMLIFGGWLLLFAIAVLAYFPGLSGPFLLDDYGSIADLGNFGGITDWETFKIFVFGGHSGPTGRPISLLSFLIDANNWPADPWPFKRTNLAIHLINAALLGSLIVRLLRVLEVEEQNARWIALMSTACWVLHPFLVSTTLYVVQRMAQLSTLFILAGLNVHFVGRALISRNLVTGYAVLTLSVVLFTLLAMLSKENGILLPLLIGVTELTIFASQRHRLEGLNRNWAIIFIIIPSAIIFLYLLEKPLRGNFFEIVPPREFSVYERFLTQPRVLMDYLKHWFVPELYTTGIFQDHFPKSTGFFSPVTTALSFLAHAAIVTAAIAYRRKWPLFAFAALFFYASHLLESTVLNLELYFEHRNYLAAVFLFVPLIAILQQRAKRQTVLAVTVVAVFVLGGFTRYSATVWQDFASIVEVSARKAPTSVRAQAQYATQLFNEGHHQASLDVISKAIEIDNSERPLLLVNRLIILCNLGVDTKGEFDSVAAILSKRPYDPRSVKLYSEFSSLVINDKCKNVQTGGLRSMYSDMLNVPRNADPTSLAFSQIQYLIGFASVHMQDLPGATAAFGLSLKTRPGAQHAMLMAAHLATAEYFDEAIEFSNIALSQLDVMQTDLLDIARVTRNDVLAFQAVVRADREAAASNDQGGS